MALENNSADMSIPHMAIKYALELVKKSVKKFIFKSRVSCTGWINFIDLLVKILSDFP